jgi:anti-sigma regulatory factor (Ser/Thr protein kinase)
LSEVLEFRVAPEPAQVRELRAEVREALESRQIAEHTVDTTVLVLDELVNNSIEHGRPYRGEADQLAVRLTLGEDGVHVAFEDPSVPSQVVGEIESLLEQVKDTAPPPFFERGRGLFLIQDGIKQLELASLDGGVGMLLTGRIGG